MKVVLFCKDCGMYGTNSHIIDFECGNCKSTNTETYIRASKTILSYEDFSENKNLGFIPGPFVGNVIEKKLFSVVPVQEQNKCVRMLVTYKDGLEDCPDIARVLNNSLTSDAADTRKGEAE